jgi:hypothetical protein
MMRRTLLFVFVLLVVGAGSAIASAAGSTQAHRKTSTRAHSATHTKSHSATKGRSTRKTSAAKPQKAAPAPTQKSTAPSSAPSPAPDNTAYAIGYRNGYDAGHAAALKELQSQTANTALSTPPSLSAKAAVAPREIQEAAEPSDADPEVDPVDATETEQETADAEIEMPRAGTRVSLRGSLASLQRQNTRLEAEGLERILDEDDLNSRIAHGLLTPLPASANLTVNPSLPENRRYCRSWTARFLTDLAKAHAAAFHKPFQVNSAVRTVEYQKRLIRTNGNAAAAVGDTVSPHITGATIDIGKRGMTRAELLWMRRTLFALQSAGKIDVEEEFAQACFHITVYKTYSAPKPVHKPAPPALREASAPEKAPAPEHHRRSSLPSSIAAGTFTVQ